MMCLKYIKELVAMGGQQEFAKATYELSSVLKELQDRMQRMEERLCAIEYKVSGHVASDPKAAWAKPANGANGAFAGINVSGSATPASVMLENTEMMLASADEQIVELIRKMGAVCADDVKAHFKYKGKNAASARLSRLHMLGILQKQQAGRKVYYKMKN